MSERLLAANICRILRESVSFARALTVKEVVDTVVRRINAVEGMEVEYFQIVNAETLQPIRRLERRGACAGLHHGLLRRAPCAPH